MTDKTIFITGIAGFIGFSLAKRLIEIYGERINIVGLDNLNDYYDVHLKEHRLSILNKCSGHFQWIHGDISHRDTLNRLFDTLQPDIVVHLAAQAGVRYSITHPDDYINSNILGFYRILETCRHHPVEHLVYASSSSVYGQNKKIPYSADDQTDQPVSLYAATKKSNELMAHAYSKLYGIPCTGLRFFTVYGPWGRPDMAYFSFTRKMEHGQKIQLYNFGEMRRDFTYIDDIIEGVLTIMQHPPIVSEEGTRYKIYNIGNNQPVSLRKFVETLEQCLINVGVLSSPVEKELLPMQPGDVYQTYADIQPLIDDFGFKPTTPLHVGLQKFASWYKTFYHS